MGRRSSANFSPDAQSEEIADVENTVKTPIINRNSDFSINAQLRKASQKMESNISNLNKLQENYMQAKNES